MKRILKFLVRLYPSAWRRRYGAEYEALLEQGTPHVRDLFDVSWGAFKMQITTWSFVRIVLPCALVGTLAAVGISLVRPAMYTSGAMVVQSSSEAPDPVDGSAPTASVQEPPIRELVRDAFADREAMAGIIGKYDLYPVERAKISLDEVVAKMRSAILVRPVSGSALDQEIDRVKQMPGRDPQSIERLKKSIRAAFTVEFEYPDPHIAQMVDASLLSLLVRRNLQLGAGRWSASCGWGCIAVMDAPTLPERPSGLNRVQLDAIGLFGGLAGGIGLAAVLGWRRRPTAVNS